MTNGKKKRRSSSTQPRRANYIRQTITIPDDLVGFVDQQKAQPRHAGSLSSYLRTLIIEAKERALAQAV